MQTHSVQRGIGITNAQQHTVAQLAGALVAPRRHTCRSPSNSPSPCSSATQTPRQASTAAAATGAPGVRGPLASEPQRQRGSVQTNVASFAVDAPTLSMSLMAEPLARAPAPVVAPTFKDFSMFVEQYAMGEMLGEGTYSKVQPAAAVGPSLQNLC